MALITLPSVLLWPGNIGTGGNAGTGNSAILTAAGHYYAGVFPAREPMTISHISFRTSGPVTGTTPAVTVSVETVDATGFPSGLWPGSGSVVSGTLVANTDVVVALSTPTNTIPIGSIFAVKLAFSAGTSIPIAHMSNLSMPCQTSLPYYITATPTATKNALNSATAQLGIGSSATTFYQVLGTFPFTAWTAGAFNNSVTGAKRGMKFTIPFDCRCTGMRFNSLATTGDYRAVLMTGDASPSELASASFVGPQNAVSSNGVNMCLFSTPVNLSRGGSYRVVIEPSSATNVTFTTATFPANEKTGSPGGALTQYTAYTGTWADDATKLVSMDIIIDKIDDGTGTGGGGGGSSEVIGS